VASVRIISEVPLTEAVAVLTTDPEVLVVGVGTLIVTVESGGALLVVAVGVGLLLVVGPPQAATTSAIKRKRLIAKERLRDIMRCVLLWYYNNVALYYTTDINRM